jgi:iron complex transport system permease protein
MKPSLVRALWPSILVFALLLIGMISLNTGSVEISLIDLLQGELTETQTLILLDIRMPRVCLNILVGAGVATAGAAIQGLFRNPLADPALIGVSSGAALFAAGFMVLGTQIALFDVYGLHRIGVSGSAFIGGLLTTLLVLMVGQRSGSISSILLAGIAVNAVALSGVGLFSYLSPDVQLRSVAFWALGSFNAADWEMVQIAMITMPFILLIFLESSKLNAITLGDSEAAHLGIFVPGLRRRIVVFTAIIVGVGVSLVGVISFIGLVVPHLIRLTLGSNHHVVVPCSALLGGILVLVADAVSRTLFAPAELPVGILTAIVGGPFFIYLIVNQRERLGI